MLALGVMTLHAAPPPLLDAAGVSTDDALSILKSALAGADDGELFLERSESESLPESAEESESESESENEATLHTHREVGLGPGDDATWITCKKRCSTRSPMEGRTTTTHKSHA